MTTSASTQTATLDSGNVFERDLALDRETVLADYRIAWESRQASLLGRREVLTGKAKFGIFGDGKEVVQLAMARAFRPGDLRSGYYRDQTFMLAAGMTTLEELFAQLYANTDPELEPASAGRQMNCHFATPMLAADGSWKDLAGMRVSVADTSPTGSQMPRLAGLAYASRLFRELPALRHMTRAGGGGFSDGGDEIAFGTIGNASCAEGMFWETINAVGVLHAPLLMSIWDDDYGISVSNEHQITKQDLSQVLAGFRRRPGSRDGYDLYRLRGWDYAAACRTYLAAARIVREEHVPAIVHIVELTQPQGHSTSGSHERYKTPERLDWERRHDGLTKMREWIVGEGFAGEADLDELERQGLEEVRRAQRQAWDDYAGPIRGERDAAAALLDELAGGSAARGEIEKIAAELRRNPSPMRRHAMAAVQRALVEARGEDSPARRRLVAWRREQDRLGRERYGSHLVSEARSALDVAAVEPRYDDDAPELNGFEIVNRGFDAAFARVPELIAFGEDVGRLGDVNQGLQGMQEKYGELRVSDTGIRECTILGQAIGMAMRGLRPLAEIQYLDYLLYALEIISDDLATVQYRTRGAQKAPVIIRTRGHRLEGIWHSGSPMSGIMNLVRGVHLCVPRDMTRAVGFYNTLLESDDSAIVVEVLNGYRTKEKLPGNLGDSRVPLGVPEILRPGTDVTLVTYGACCRVALAAAERLAGTGIEVEIVDVQTLLPFDRPGVIGRSLRRTHRVVFLDEDVPGGATATMMQEVLENQDGFHWLDSPPRTLSARPHRPAYGSDGDYWSKPQVEHVFETVYELMNESDPGRFPIFYR
jgi:pyruvate/2-oxoglutarate/acetoin dehydrogenase E1 component/TPP-dependent pyruvate/acetoin dehydrogenase alpha subunit